MLLNFGKYCGFDIAEVPTHYLNYIAKWEGLWVDTKSAIIQELNRRGNEGTPISSNLGARLYTWHKKAQVRYANNPPMLTECESLFQELKGVLGLQ